MARGDVLYLLAIYMTNSSLQHDLGKSIFVSIILLCLSDCKITSKLPDQCIKFQPRYTNFTDAENIWHKICTSKDRT